MRTLTLFLAGLLSLTASAASQVPNGDFELWQSGSYTLPSGFLYSSNQDRFYQQAFPFNVAQTTDAYQGQYAVKLTTGLSFGDSPNFGYLLNYPPDGESTEAYPLTETPTGLRGYYKYSPLQGDSGVILVNLLKGSSILVNYTFVIKGVQPTYTRFEIPFNQPLDQTPDGIQVGFASSFNESMAGVPGTELYLDSIGLTGVTTQPQDMAGDFESWNYVQHNLPFGWTIDGRVSTSQPKTDICVNGHSALELKSILDIEEGIQRAEHRRVTSGYRNEDTGDVDGRIYLSGTEDTLSFYYSYQPSVPGDSCQLTLRLYKGNDMVNFIFKPLLATQGYHHMLVPLGLHELYSPKADSLVIEFTSGMWSNTAPAAANSVLRVDAVTLLDYKGDNPDDPHNPINPITETTLFPNGGFEAWEEVSYDYPTNYGFNSNLLEVRQGGHNMNVQKTTNAQHGSYALKLISQNSTSDFNFGFVMNVNGNDGDPSTWFGGFPIQGRPTGISGYYQYNESTSDSGLIIVGFNKNGQVLHTYMLPLKGQVTSYTAFDITFDPPLTEDPDSMVLGFASTVHLDGGAWPGTELLIDNVSIKGIANQPAGLNGDFEDWKIETLATPVGWYNENWQEGSFSRTTDAAEGLYAVYLTTTLEENREEGGHIAVGRSLSNGYWDDALQRDRGGVAFSNTKDTLTFMYKYIPANIDDRGLVELNFMRDGESIWHQTMGLRASDTYTKARIPINLYQYSWTPRPDSLLVKFRSSHWENTDSTYAGARLWIDDIHFASEFYLPPAYNPNAPNPPVPNGSFEEWKTTNYDAPVYYPYTTDNQMQPWLGLDPFVMKTTDAQHGQFALKLVSRTFGDEAIPGYISNYNVNSDEDVFDWHGGSPIAEKPSGLKGYYKYNMGVEDTAMIIVAFSKAGINTGTYFFTLEGPKSSYTPFEFTLDPPLAETPDSLILAIASSYVAYEHAYGGSELYLDNLELTGVTQQPAQLNGDFEDWLTNSSESPLHWASMGDVGTMVKSNVAVHGQHALSLRTLWSETDSTLVPGMVISSDQSILFAYSEAGFPITNLKDTLAFHYLYTPTQQDDRGTISLYMAATSTDYWDYQPLYTPLRSGVSKTSLKAPNRMNEYVWSNQLQLEPCTTYQYMEIPFDLTQHPIIPDRMIIMLCSTNREHDDAAYAGSELLIDNIHFRSSTWPVSVEGVKAPTDLSLYPNPSMGPTRLVDPQGLYERIEVFNLMGQRVTMLTKDKGMTEVDMDLSGQPAGLYLIRLSHGGEHATLKLVLK